MEELDWALANMGGAKSKKTTKKSADELIEADAKVSNKEEVCVLSPSTWESNG